MNDMFIDAHTHLDKYGCQLSAVIGEIEANQIFTWNVSMDLESYAKGKELDASCQYVISSFGIHPWNAPDVHKNLHSLDPLIADSPMIGEVGLDYHFVTERTNYDLQRDVFEYFVSRAVAQNKILNIHSKGAEADVDSILGALNARRAIVHWYSGPLNVLDELTDEGVYITVGVEMLFDPHIQSVAKAVPAELLLTETDNPGGYRWLTGITGTPTLIKSVVDKLSELRGWRSEAHSRIDEGRFGSLRGVEPAHIDWQL